MDPLLSLGSLVFGAAPPPSFPGSDLIEPVLDLGCDGGFSVPARTSCNSSDENCNSALAVTHSKSERGMPAPCGDFFEGENKSACVLCAYLSACVCVEAVARDGLEEIYITKHPQVHREISKTGIRAGTIKEWFQDVRGGERKEGGGGGGGGLEGFLKPPWLHTARA